MMISLNAFLIVFLVNVCIILCDKTKKCDPMNPKPLKDVQLNEIHGRWFIHNFAQHKDILPPHLFLQEYSLDFRNQSKIIVNGRNSTEPHGCFYYVSHVDSTGKPSAWKSFYGYLKMSVEHRILDTDYQNYILVWTCVDLEKNKNSCDDWYLYVMTRTVQETLSEPVQKAANESMVETACYHKMMVVKYGQWGEVCKRFDETVTAWSESSGTQHKLQVLWILLIVFFGHQLHFLFA